MAARSKEIGLSLANQGDIDTQAIAGALSTGTHGTGIRLGRLSSQAVGMRLVQPDGSVLEVDGDGDTETMAAAQVSIGMLGVISTITLQAISAYNLKETLWREDFDSCMERHDELAANNRHFSFFWCPVADSRHLYCLPDVASVSKVKREHDVCEMKVMNVTDEAPYSDEKTYERVAYSSDIYPIEYIPNFHELEYAIPVETGKDALRQIRELMLTKHTNCIYPVEYRFVAGDTGMLSPYYRRASVTISVSGGPGIDYWSYLIDVDAILRHRRPTALGQAAFQSRGRHAVALSALSGLPSDPPQNGPVGLLSSTIICEICSRDYRDQGWTLFLKDTGK